MLYFFILGRQPILSLAEIFSTFREEANLIDYFDNFAIFAFKKELNPVEILDDLGGSIKFGQIIKEDIKNIKEIIFNSLFRQNKENKIFFGISVYGKSEVNPFVLGLEIKKKIKENNRSCRFVTSREKVLSSVVVKKNKLLSPFGAEFVILGSEKRQYLGKTLAVQEFEEYGIRDYLKPARSMVKGMLPPKLAKIMVNLARIPKDGTILDPFCGTGTVLCEAMLLGYKNLIGTDNDEQSLKATEKNIGWLRKNFHLFKTNALKAQIQLFKQDARTISKIIKPKSIDAIITEPYLGPPLKGKESPQEIKGIILTLENLYLESLREFKRVLKSDGTIVFAIPIFQIKKHLINLDLKEKIKEIGFQIINPLPEEVQRKSKDGQGPNGGFIYSRPDQWVWREILILKSAANRY